MEPSTAPPPSPVEVYNRACAAHLLTAPQALYIGTQNHSATLVLHTYPGCDHGRTTSVLATAYWHQGNLGPWAPCARCLPAAYNPLIGALTCRRAAATLSMIPHGTSPTPFATDEQILATLLEYRALAISASTSLDPHGVGLAAAGAALHDALDAHLLDPHLPPSVVMRTPSWPALTPPGLVQAALNAGRHGMPEGLLLINDTTAALLNRSDHYEIEHHVLTTPLTCAQAALLAAGYSPQMPVATQVEAALAASA